MTLVVSEKFKNYFTAGVVDNFKTCFSIFDIYVIDFPLIVQVKNVDDVLECHNDFLNNCLKDCMLTSPILLHNVSELMNVCIQFCQFIQVRNYKLLLLSGWVSHTLAFIHLAQIFSLSYRCHGFQAFRFQFTSTH